jgi:EAL domain-containing protein (putative c-di-GMP-specific phosphodiesterase class I)
MAHLETINQSLGRDTTDELLRAFAAVFGDTAQRYPDALAARLNGADFALLLPGVVGAQTIAASLLQSLILVTSAFVPGQATTWMGCGNFPRGIEIDSILSQVDAALAAAQADGCDGLRVITMGEGESLPKSAKEWSNLIHRALEKNWVRLVSFPVLSFDGSLMHRECPLRLMFDEQGEWQAAGLFWPVAERLRLTPQLDLAAVGLGLDELEGKPTLPGLAINLSASSIQLPEFRADLHRLLLRRSGTSRLWLEVSESGALAHFEAFCALCRELRDVGCQIGLEHFGRQFSEVGRLHDLGLDYLKVDASFVRGLDVNPGNQAFLKGLSTIAHGIGLKVIAEGVASKAELLTLQQVGFDGATGPVIQDIALT